MCCLSAVKIGSVARLPSRCLLPGLAWKTSSAGVGNDADVLVDAELLAWADLIFVMEPVHRRKLTARFRSELASKRVWYVSTSRMTLTTWRLS